MATVNLHPNSTDSNQWTIVGGSGTVHQNLADSDDTSLVRDNANGRTFEISLDDYSAGGTINSIRFYIRGVMFNARSGNTDIRVRISDSSTTYYTEEVTLNFTSGYAPEDHYGTARTTYDGSNAWTDGILDGIKLNVATIEDPPGPAFAQINKAYIEVTYTPAGYGNDVMGVDSGDISSINGVATANISKVNGV
tara:strand:- start:32 stop:613 length:582 start_codon:yes stop_codon:yes gene_type:complete